MKLFKKTISINLKYFSDIILTKEQMLINSANGSIYPLKFDEVNNIRKFNSIDNLKLDFNSNPNNFWAIKPFGLHTQSIKVPV